MTVAVQGGDPPQDERQAASSQRTAGPSDPAAEAVLVARAQRGERAAIEQILERHAGQVERLAHGLVRNPMDAEDVVQDVLVTVTDRIGHFRGDAALSTWIHRIAVNAAAMRLRRDRTFRLVPLDDASPNGACPQATAESAGQRPLNPALRREFWDLVWDAVDQLDAKQRTAFLLRAVDGLSMEEAAHSLGLKVSTYKTRLHRARLALRARLAPYFDYASVRGTAGEQRRHR